MQTISITMIGHNEVFHIERLHDQLNHFHEVIYVDCESTDGSLEQAKKNGWKVFSRPNTTQLNINKQYAMDQATGDWIFYLDPDETIPNDLLNEIKTTIANTTDSAFTCPRKNHFFGAWLKHGSQYPDTQLRLFKRGFAKFPNLHVHEKLSVQGNTGSLKHDMLHYPYINISQFLKKFDFYTSFEANFLYKNGFKPSCFNTIQFCLIKPIGRFFRRYFIRKGCLDGWRGFFAAFFDAANFIVRYLKLREIDENKTLLGQDKAKKS